MDSGTAYCSLPSNFEFIPAYADMCTDQQFSSLKGREDLCQSMLLLNANRSCASCICNGQPSSAVTRPVYAVAKCHQPRSVNAHGQTLTHSSLQIMTSGCVTVSGTGDCFLLNVTMTDDHLLYLHCEINGVHASGILGSCRLISQIRH